MLPPYTSVSVAASRGTAATTPMNEMTIMAKTKAGPAAVPTRQAPSAAGSRDAAPAGQSPEAGAQ
jgi:hypothetical protein